MHDDLLAQATGRGAADEFWRRWVTSGDLSRVMQVMAAARTVHRDSGSHLGYARISASLSSIHVPGWTGVRKVKDDLTADDLYGFLTTDPNEIVAPIHEKAMPVLLMTQDETDVWMNALWEEAQHLARPAPSDAIMVTSREPYGSSIVSKEGEPMQASL